MSVSRVMLHTGIINSVWSVSHQTPHRMHLHNHTEGVIPFDTHTPTLERRSVFGKNANPMLTELRRPCVRVPYTPFQCPDAMLWFTRRVCSQPNYNIPFIANLIIITRVRSTQLATNFMKRQINNAVIKKYPSIEVHNIKL